MRKFMVVLVAGSLLLAACGGSPASHNRGESRATSQARSYCKSVQAPNLAQCIDEVLDPNTSKELDHDTDELNKQIEEFNNSNR